MAVAKAAQETMMVNAMKRQMEGHEEKLEGQLARIQQHSERLRERLDSKMVSVETMNLKCDRKLAELSGNYKGLSEEMQSQIRRIDGLDTKLWEWRHQVDEENRNKFAEVEQGVQKLTSQVRLSNATMEDSFKRFSLRVRRLEQVIEERLSYSDETNNNLMTLDARLAEIEHARLQELTLVPTPSDPAGSAMVSLEASHGDVRALNFDNGEVMATVEARLSEAFRKLDHVSKESQDVQTRVEAQEERLRSLRTIVDAKEENYRVAKFDRQDWESKAKELHSFAHELERHRIDHSERLDVMMKRLENHDTAQEEVSDEVRKMQERTLMESTAFGGSAGLSRDIDDSFNNASREESAAIASAMDRAAERLASAEDRVNTVTSQLAAAQGDVELAPRVAALVESLKQVAPKVMDQEVSMRELTEKVGHLDAKVMMLCDQSKTGPGHEPMVARLGQLEFEMRRLCAEIEGTEPPPA